MEIAEEADGAAIGTERGQHAHIVRLGDAFRLDRIAIFVKGLEVLAVQHEVGGVFPFQNGIGLGAGGDQNGLGREHGGFPGADEFVLLGVEGELRHGDGVGVAEAVDGDFFGREAFSEVDALFERLGDFFVIQRVGRRIDHSAAVGERDAAPGLEELQIDRVAAFGGGLFVLGANGAGVGEELVGDDVFFFVPDGANGGFGVGGTERFVAFHELLHLDRVVRERFGGRVDRGQTAADDHGGQAQLEIGDGVTAGGTGQLQCHEEVRRLADAAGEAVLHRNDRRTAGAGAEGNVIEAELEGAIDGDRPAEAHAAEHGERTATLDQEADDLEEVLVPANGDAIFGDAAEAGHDAVVERFVNLVDLANGAEGFLVPVGIDTGEVFGEGFDFETVDGADGVAVVQQVMGERVAGRAEADDENFVAGVGFGQRPIEV